MVPNIDPDTAQEYIDDARREAERCADVAIADLKAEVEDLRAQVKELEPLRPLLNVLRSIHEHPGQNAPQMGHPIYWTFYGTTLIASGPESERLMYALNCAAFDVMPKSDESK